VGVPVVAIVGRPNVGKSSLFNWLVGRRISIVEPTAGVTRDRVSSLVEVDGRFFELTDTGGIGIVDLDNLAADVDKQIQYAIDQSDVVLFVVDARSGPMPLDETVADRLRVIGKPVICVVNKTDDEKYDLNASEFHRLGYQPVVSVSAVQHRGKSKLLHLIVERLPEIVNEAPPEQVHLELAIVGRRNAGKSTFINSLAQAERVIVSELPGTTRDSVDVRFERDGKTFVAIDTAGVRHRSSLANSIEFYSMARAERSIRRADVVLHFLDATQKISRVDKQLTDFILENHKPAIFVVNKWDLVKDQVSMPEFAEYIKKTFPMLDHVPISFVTAKSGRNVYKLLNLAQQLVKQARERVTTGELNRVLRQALEMNPPATKRSRLPKVFYATQIATSPPTIAIFTNGPQLFDAIYERYLLKVFRGHLPFSEVAIKIQWRSRRGGTGAAAADGDALAEENKAPPKAAAKPKRTPARKKNANPELWDV
jgi:GTPase